MNRVDSVNLHSTEICEQVLLFISSLPGLAYNFWMPIDVAIYISVNIISIYFKKYLNIFFTY